MMGLTLTVFFTRLHQQNMIRTYAYHVRIPARNWEEGYLEKCALICDIAQINSSQGYIFFR
jgi:hypothetical protein